MDELTGLLNHAKITDAGQIENIFAAGKPITPAQIENLLTNHPLNADELAQLLGNAKIADATQIENIFSIGKPITPTQIENLWFFDKSCGKSKILAKRCGGVGDYKKPRLQAERLAPKVPGTPLEDAIGTSPVA